MTYPTGSGTITNNTGPVFPSGNVGAAPPYGAPGAASNVAEPANPTQDPATWNYTNSETSTQKALSTSVYNVAQQGVLAATNTAAVILAGVSSRDFTYFTGINDAKG